jgi:hypothetical protein
MRCKDIQKYLAVDVRLSRLPAKVRAHLLKCPGCRQAQMVYAEIDRELREQPAWQPPSEFAERVSLQGLGSLKGVPPKPQGFLRIIGPAFAAASVPILLGLLAAMFCLLVLLNAPVLATSYPAMMAEFSRIMLANASQLAWITGILSICFSAWITQRALR